MWVQHCRKQAKMLWVKSLIEVAPRFRAINTVHNHLSFSAVMKCCCKHVYQFLMSNLRSFKELILNWNYVETPQLHHGCSGPTPLFQAPSRQRYETPLLTFTAVPMFLHLREVWPFRRLSWPSKLLPLYSSSPGSPSRFAYPTPTFRVSSLLKWAISHNKSRRRSFLYMWMIQDALPLPQNTRKTYGMVFASCSLSFGPRSNSDCRISGSIQKKLAVLLF